MKEQVDKILEELNLIKTKFSDIRDLFWLKLDRYSKVDVEKGVKFDEKYDQQCSKLSRAINAFSNFVEKHFEPSKEEIAREKALQKLRFEFPNFNEWSTDVQNALIKKEVEILMSSNNKFVRKEVVEKRIKDELEKINILNNDRFSDEFWTFYNGLSLPGVNFNLQNNIIRKYLSDKGYDENLISSLKQRTVRSAPKLLQVTFPDGTVLRENKAILTFIKTIDKIGVEKVFDLKMNTLVRRDENFRKSAKIVRVGEFYVDTHSSTTEKKRQLDIISQKLNLNLLVEIKER